MTYNTVQKQKRNDEIISLHNDGKSLKEIQELLPELGYSLITREAISHVIRQATKTTVETDPKKIAYREKQEIVKLRNEKVIELWIQGHKKIEIAALLPALGYREITDGEVGEIIRNHEMIVATESYNERKTAGVEKAIIRQRNEATYQRKVNREVLLDSIKNEDMLETIRNIVSEIKPVTITAPKGKTAILKLTGGTRYGLISDLHWGILGTMKKANGKKYTIREKLDMFFKSLLDSPEKDIVAIMPGDLFHNLATAGMHDGMFLDMEIISPHENILTFSNYLVEKIGEFRSRGKTIKLILIPGNHVRTTKNKHEDPQKTLFCAFAEIIKARFFGDKNVEIIYAVGDVPMTYSGTNLDFVIAHGENGFSKLKLEAYKPRFFPRSTRHLVVLSGHLHNLNIRNGWDTTHISLPCVGGSDSYSDLFGYRSNTGYVTIVEKNGLPVLESTFFED